LYPPPKLLGWLFGDTNEFGFRDTLLVAPDE
jgi:hypothetical protein